MLETVSSAIRLASHMELIKCKLITIWGQHKNVVVTFTDCSKAVDGRQVNKRCLLNMTAPPDSFWWWSL